MKEPGTTLDERTRLLLEDLTQSAQDGEKIQGAIRRILGILQKQGVTGLEVIENMLDEHNDNLRRAQQGGEVLSEQLGQLQELVHTSALITSSLELNQVLEEVIDTVIKLTGAERAYLMLRQPDTDDLRIQAARNWNQENINAEEATFSRSIITKAIQSGPFITNNAQADDDLGEMQSVIAHDLRSVIVVPLMLREEVVGVLYADNRISAGVFGAESVPILNAFANQAAIAISNARLFERVQDDLRQAQREVKRLQIEIDKTRLDEKVAEITESDYFRDLRDRAKDMRRTRLDGDTD